MTTQQNGIITTDFGFSDEARSVIVQADGKLVVAGYSGANFAVARYNSNGGLDNTFNGDGKVLTVIGSINDKAYSLIDQPDGKHVVAGSGYDATSGYYFALVRYNSDGSLDTSFDNDGKVTTAVSSTYGEVGVDSVIVQSDGKLVVTGSNNHNFTLMRYNSDGSLDSSFNGNGIGSINSSAQASSVIAQPDGKLVVVGSSYYSTGYSFTLARCNADGSLDSSFDGDGIVTTTVGSWYVPSSQQYLSESYANSAIIQSDDKLVVAGYSYNGTNYDFTLVRYNGDGSLDTSFSVDGKVTTDFGFDDRANSVIVQPDGKLVVAGSSDNGTSTNITLARYNSDGSLDTTFDGDGILTTAIGASSDLAYSVTVQADGKLVVAGTSNNGTNKDFALVRYNSDGSLDSTFNGSLNNPPTGTVSISGTPEQNQVLTVSNTLADADGLGTISYQWDANGNSIGTGDSYTLTQADVGKIITVTASYTDGLGNAESVSSLATAAVLNVNDAPTGDVIISGIAKQGETLTASNTLADLDGLGTISYQWKANGSIISTGDSYTLTPAEVGKTIAVTASYIDSQGTAESQTSSTTTTVAGLLPSVVITALNPLNPLNPTISVTGENGSQAHYSIVLNTQPTEPVAITFTSTDTTEGIIAVPTLRFTASNWDIPQTLVVTGVNDSLNDGDENYNVTAKIVTNDANYLNVKVPNLGLINKSDGVELYGDPNGIPTSDMLTGTPNEDRLYGGDMGDVLNGLAGNDKLYGEVGDDKLFGGDGNDTLYGGYDDDKIVGGNNDDLLYGEEGNDLLIGGTGNDTLDGGLGLDTLIGGAGNDTYYLGYDFPDVIQDNGLPTDKDTVIMPYELNSYTLAANIENGKIDGTGAADLSGNSLDNILTGNDGNNVLSGGLGADDLIGNMGNDTLKGGIGVDTMEGGSGSDTYFLSTDAMDVIIDNGTDPNEKDVVVIPSQILEYTLPANIENGNLTAQVLTASTPVIRDGNFDNILTGNGENNILTGNNGRNDIKGDKGDDVINASGGDDLLEGGDGNDTLIGGNDNDTLDGGTGADFMVGGSGADRYIVDNPGDFILEAASTDIDTVASSINWILNDNVENLELTGIAAINATGNKLSNILTGNNAANSLSGGDSNDILTGNAGNDTLDGGAGTDVMDGGTGADLYIVDNTADQIIETSTITTEIDTVQSSVNWTLSDNLENLLLTDSITNSAIKATGNTLANVLTGNSAANSFSGGDGNDTLNGGDGNDVLDGGTGADKMIGGFGADRYLVDNTGDVVIETPSLEIDTIFSSISWTLGDYVDNLTLTGASMINATGNDLDNVLTGNSAANTLIGGIGSDTLFGGDGNDYLSGNADNDNLSGGNGDDTLDGGNGVDTMVGGSGSDLYIVDNPGDVITEAISAEIDTVKSSVSWLLGIGLDNLILTGSSAINAAGNGLVNNLEGNNAANSLSGSAGNDTLIGNDGNDTLDGGTGGDSMVGGAGSDLYIVDNASDSVTEASTLATEIDTVQSFISWTLNANVENLVLMDSVLRGTGNELANVITGNSAANSLNGGDGNDILNGGDGDDILDGGTGMDTMVGGSGNDSYLVDNISDVIIETSATDMDTVLSSIDWTLDNNLENLTLTGSSTINATGNELDNSLVGNNADNSLTGGLGDDSLNGNGGNDTLDGGIGADTMVGGLGSDLYIVDNAGDIVSDTSSIATEIDTVQSSVSWALGGYVENLTLTGLSAINASGNALANVLIGNDATNILNGKVGNDTLTGGGGNDIFQLTTLSTDTITDFNVNDDTIQLENDVFKSLTTLGTLNAANFKIGSVASDANDYVFYDNNTGALFYDADGSGAKVAVQIAVLGVNLDLSNADFVVI